MSSRHAKSTVLIIQSSWVCLCKTCRRARQSTFQHECVKDSWTITSINSWILVTSRVESTFSLMIWPLLGCPHSNIDLWMDAQYNLDLISYWKKKKKEYKFWELIGVGMEELEGRVVGECKQITLYAHINLPK